MYDVTWRTGLTLAILLLLVLLGSGKLLESTDLRSTPLPAGEGTPGASDGADPAPPEPGAGLAAGQQAATPPRARADTHRLPLPVLPVPR